jgi:alkaline phosphatase D
MKIRNRHDRLQSGLVKLFPSMLLLILVISNAINLPSSIHGQTTNNSILTINGGVASGDVSYKSAMIWSRINNQSVMHTKYDNNSEFTHSSSSVKWVDNKTDLAGKIKVDNLRPNTKYFYKVWFSSPDNSVNSSAVLGSFRTAPNPNSSDNSISFLIGADMWSRVLP